MFWRLLKSHFLNLGFAIDGVTFAEFVGLKSQKMRDRKRNRMPNRILQETICDSERLDSVSAEAERLYCRLLVKADDMGRFEATPLAVGAACFPRMFQESKQKKITANLKAVDSWLNELAGAKLVFFYTHQARKYLVFYNWRQRLDRIKTK